MPPQPAVAAETAVADAGPDRLDLSKDQTIQDQLNLLRFYRLALDKVCVTRFEDSAPPWRNDRLWQAANQTLTYLMHCHNTHLRIPAETASRVDTLMESMDGLLDRLGKETCARCASPCCLTADVYYDFKDLLFLHLTQQKTPDGQPRLKNGDVCRYLEAGGCRIPRRQRPWICTWYICAVQKNFLIEHPEFGGGHLQSTIAQIGKLRKQTESIFIDVVL